MGDFLDFGTKNQLKIEYALINQAIAQKRAKANLYQEEFSINSLDSARVDTVNENLFNNILTKSIKSTSSLEKRSGSWAKTGAKDYLFFTKNSEYKFSFKNGLFTCVSSEELCRSLD